MEWWKPVSCFLLLTPWVLHNPIFIHIGREPIKHFPTFGRTNQRNEEEEEWEKKNISGEVSIWIINFWERHKL